MADNVAITLGDGGAFIAADEIGGVKHQRVKVQFGADGNALDVSAAAPLPVEVFGGAATPLTDVQLRASAVAVTGPLTDTQLRASAVPVTLSSEDVYVVERVVPLSTVTGVINTAGDNTIIATPGVWNRLVIVEMTLQLEAYQSTTVIVKSGATARQRLLLVGYGDGVTWVHDQGRELRLAENEALVLNLSGANAVGYTIRYFTEAV